MRDWQLDFHQIDYILLQKWSEMSIDDLHKEKDVLESKMKILPESSVSVRGSMNKVMKALETFIDYRETQKESE